MKNKVQTIFKFNYYGCEKSYNQHRVQIECDDTCNYEHHCRSKSARSSRRSGLWLIVGILLPVRRSRLPDPDGMVAAELAAMFSDKQGGVFRWVGEAYGARTGFLAIWLQWIESTIWYPTVLTFGAVSIALSA